jgi:hypothetical protein
MRTSRGLALGTYYAAGANAARETPNSSQMRGLVYAVKDNRDPQTRSNRSSTHSTPQSARSKSIERTRSST